MERRNRKASVKGKIVSRESFPTHPTSRKARARRFCDRDICRVVLSAGDERCSQCKPTKVHGQNERLCIACHQPSSDWTHFRRFTCHGRLNISRMRRRVVRRTTLSMLEGYQPSIDCLCTRSDYVALFREEGGDSRRTEVLHMYNLRGAQSFG